MIARSFIRVVKLLLQIIKNIYGGTFESFDLKKLVSNVNSADKAANGQKETILEVNDKNLQDNVNNSDRKATNGDQSEDELRTKALKDLI